MDLKVFIHIDIVSSRLSQGHDNTRNTPLLANISQCQSTFAKIDKRYSTEDHDCLREIMKDRRIRFKHFEF